MSNNLIANEYITSSVREAGNRNIQKIREGKIRNHKLGNNSLIHYGELEEEELGQYLNFLPTKTCALILELTGNCDYE